MSEQLATDRPPRIQPELPFGTVEIPKPPDQRTITNGRIVQVALPLTTIIGYIIVSALSSSGRSPLLIIPMALSVVASTAFALYSYRREEQARTAEREAYAARLLELYREMRAAHEAQRRFASYNYPDPAATLAIARHAQAIAHDPASQPTDVVRLWERRIGDADFGLIRLGTATLPSTMVYTLQESEGDSTLRRDALKLAADSRFVEGMPVTLQVRPPPPSPDGEQPDDGPPHPPFSHALAIAGAAEPARDLCRAALAHAATFHAPSDLRLLLLAPQREAWAWVTELPHAAGEEGATTLFLDAAGALGADPEQGSPLERWCEELRRTLAQRKIRLQNPDEQASEDPTLPQLLVVIDLLEAADNPEHPLHNLAQTDAGLGILLAEGASVGAAVVFLVPRRAKAPGGCTALVEVERAGEGAVLRYAEVGLNTLRLLGFADCLSARDATTMAKALAELRLQQSEGGSLAKSVSFLELMLGKGAPEISVPALVTQARGTWGRSEEERGASWLRARLGLMAGNKERALVFSANRDGVHGLVAGSTGSGKSELLIALIAGMAATYSPAMLNFVLVDYKGGGAFEPFRKLPHCVDVVTNLDGGAVARMLTSIRAELDRRQRLNTERRVNTIVEYHKKGLHLRPNGSYPFLFIVIDEFAEMIADRAEAKAQLEQITRIGRSLGVHLLLAAQRPSGVTDQMRSNIKYRVCLRVESQAESREMLRRTEAAFLPTGIPGRGYLQVGNEEIELIQVAYAGELYLPPGQRNLPPVRWLRHGASAAPSSEQPPRPVYLEVIDGLQTLAAELAVSTQRAPWPGPLPTRLALSDPLADPRSPGAAPITDARYLERRDLLTLGGEPDAALSLSPPLVRWLTEGEGWERPLDWRHYATRPVVGLADAPAAARQYPLAVELGRGHAVIYGAPGAGKTTFVRALVTSLAASHPPDLLHVYVLDLGGRALAALADLPHVGAVITPNEAEASYRERVEQLIRELGDLIERRKGILGEAREETLEAFNTRYPEQAMAAIVLAIDNLTEFVESFGGQVEGGESGLERLIALARQCKPYGVHLVVTAGQPMQVPSQLAGFLTERFALRLADYTHYRDVLGGHVAEVADLPGRGYALVDQQPLSVQVATVAPDELERLAKRQTHVVGKWPPERRARLPFKVEALPKATLLRGLLARAEGTGEVELIAGLGALMARQWRESLRPEASAWLSAPIGVTSGNKTRALSLKATDDGVHGMVAGGTGAGKSELLMSLIVSLAMRYDPAVLNFVLVDFKGGGAFDPFCSLPHVVDLVTNLNKSAVRRMFTAIGAEMDRRSQVLGFHQVKDVVEYRAKGLHLQQGLNRGPLPHLFIIIDEYAEMISASPEFRDELDRITRIGRSLGVNLLLAAQRPVGVTDQMRANIKLRICLRVEGPDTSRELLRRPDAAFLPGGIPGRGYLQVGNDQIELIQVAYTGEPVQGQPLTERGEPPRFFEVVVRAAEQLMATTGGKRPDAPWPPPLPTALTFDPLAPADLPETEALTLARRHADGISLAPELAAWLHDAGAWAPTSWDEALQPVVGLLDDPRGARQLPLRVNLNRGHVVLFGGSGTGKTSFIRSLVLSLAATHPPEALNVHLLDLGGRSHQLLLPLPHVGTLIVPDDGGYDEQVQLLWRELATTLEERKLRFAATGAQSLKEYNRRHPDAPLPAILLVIDTIAEFIDTFAQRSSTESPEDNPYEQFITLARQGKTYGLHIMITANRLSAISSKLYGLFSERLALQLADADEYAAIVGGRVEPLDEVQGRGVVSFERQPLSFQTALLPPGPDPEQDEKGLIEMMGAAMNLVLGRRGRLFTPPIRLSALPERVPYRDVLAQRFNITADEANFAAALRDAVEKSWKEQAGAPDWLSVPLGVASGNLPRELTLAAQKDGVHGMVAGGTGSGKSELLMTFVIGLAMVYPPSVLNFVLVDYKGGGAFKPFEGLPHCVESVTNLNTSSVHRMFTAISAEIRRRQKLNADTGTKDIVDYRRKGFHAEQAYPHLVIIIDEYAEMIESEPDYRLQLESITRVGRAQGVHLLLASQRPKGVSDQMRANIKLRLCLRVEDADTSRELLRRPDAARLPSGRPGRGFLQGGGDRIELVQVAYCGDSTPPPNDAPTRWPERRLTNPPETPPLYEYAVQIAAATNGDAPVRRPWPGALPNAFSLETPLPDWMRQEQRAMRMLRPELSAWLIGESDELWPGVVWGTTALKAVVGLVDDPDEAAQDPLVLDLGRSHLAVFGDGGSGKTTLLRSIIASLASTHRPDELHVYVIDMAGQGFRSLEGYPHVGALISADEELFDERLRRLIDTLSREADARQQRIAGDDASSFVQYNQRRPEAPMPAILVVIDNIAALQESYEALIESALVPLVRRALGVGITLAVAGNTPASMTSRLGGLFGERLTFRQTNADRYLDIVGRGAVELEDLPGRGYIRAGGRPLLFQAAQPVGIYSAEGRPLRAEQTDLRLIGQRMNAQARRIARPTLPLPIETLQQMINLASLPAPAADPALVSLGVGSTLQPVQVDLRRSGPHFTVIGPPLSGKTTTLRSWALSLADRCSPEQLSLVLVDLQGRLFDYGGELSLRRLPQVAVTVSEPEELAPLLDWLEAECPRLAAEGRRLVMLIDNFDEFSEELESGASGGRAKQLARLARRYGRDGLHLVIAAGVEGGTSELRRRIQASGYGLGLRTAAALGPLKVIRLPAGLEGRELPLGRGYLVKSGQTSLVQVATPYPLGPAVDEERQVAENLDAWVARLAGRYPPREVRAAAPASSSDPTVLQLQRLLRLAQGKLHQLGTTAGAVMASRIEALDEAAWNSKAALLALAPEVLPLLDPHLPTYLVADLDETSLILELNRYVHDTVGSQP